MQAVVVNRHGGVEALELIERPDPVLTPGMARVQVAYAGLNFIDIYQREGRYPDARPPLPLGVEGSGVITGVESGSPWRVGDRVGFTTGVQGTYAQQLLVPVEHLVRVPAGTPLRTAAALLEQGLTALVLVEDVARLQPGATALVHAAAGGVGGLLVQLLKARGVRTLGVVSSPGKADWLATLGIETVLSQGGSPWPAQVAALTGSRGVAVVFDSVGAATLEASLESLAERGHLVLYGAASGPVAAVSVPALMAGSLTVTRPRMHHYLRDPAVLGNRAAALFAAVAHGELQLRVHATLPLAQVAEAQTLLASRTALGKVLLAVDESLECRS